MLPSAQSIYLQSKTSSLTSARSESSIIDSLYEEQENEDDGHVETKDFQESSSKGKVKGSIMFQYFFAGGNCCFVSIVLILYVLAQALASGADFFVSYWTNVEETRVNNNVNSTSEVITKSLIEPNESFFTRENCIYIYTGLIIALFFVALARSMLFYKMAMLSSQKLHDMMFSSVIYSPMRFFDTNPSGRILNRFSKDVGAIDELLPKAVLDAAQILLLMVGSLVLVALVNPYFLIPVAVLGFVFYLLRIIFLRSSKNIKRLEGMSKYYTKYFFDICLIHFVWWQ